MAITNYDALIGGIEQRKKMTQKGGFFDLPKQDTCLDREHEPPKHLCIPQGKGYRHVCPGCGKTIDIIPQQVTC